MLYKSTRKKLCRHLLVGGALILAGFAGFSCSDTYDLDSEQPSNLNNIYGYLSHQGNYKNCLRLIDDLGLSDILAKTGSKTMFAADDDAFADFYKSNPWGVGSYEELSYTQKKLLLNSAMIDNPFSTSMLSTAEGPTKGVVCRRASSLTIYDSVMIVASNSPEAEAILPHNSRFDAIRAYNDSVVLFTDASTAPPLIHFNYKYLDGNKLVSSDVDFLYNQPAGTRGNEDVYVNNAHITEPNIFCKNGFIHKVDRVILPLDNMAEIIRKDPETSIYSSIIERFAIPDSTLTMLDAYNRARYGDNIDLYQKGVYIKRYYSDRSAGSDDAKDLAVDKDKDGITFDASLKFDPGWNGYFQSGKERNAMMEDMAVMLVPTNDAVIDWWNNGGGKVIKDFYGKYAKIPGDVQSEIDAVPNSVLDNLVNVNQLIALTKAVPSHFSEILNENNEPLNVTTSDVKDVTLGCNGVVYKTNQVFEPGEYSSVLFPAIVDTTNFKIIENAVSCLDYDKYLNATLDESTGAGYIFLIPTNDGLLSYVDPVSYGQTSSQLWEFHFDPSKTKRMRIYADVYKCNLNETTGAWEKDGDKIYTVKDMKVGTFDDNLSPISENVLTNRLKDLLDNIIVTTKYNPSQHYYRTKGNTFVRIDGIDKGSKVWGAFQTERNTPLTVLDVYNMRNGYTLVMDGPVMGTRKSVAMTISEIEEFSEFYGILKNCGALSNSNGKDSWTAVASGDGLGNLFNLKNWGDIGAENKPKTASGTQKATYLLNNFHYTMYIPTNDAMEKAYAMGLPTLADLALAEEYDREQVEDLGMMKSDSAARVMEVMLDFVKYHIQTNSVYVDGGFASGSYESGKTELIASTKSNESVTEADLVNYDIVGDPTPNGDGTYTIIYRDGTYTSGRPYPIKVNVSSSGITLTDKLGNTSHVVSTAGLKNLQADEYWIKGSFGPTANPYQFMIDNSSSVAVHGIDAPLVYSKDQFVYKLRPLNQEVKRR